MSFGFGFALPAYPLRGGGGNNPFNQLGPTLDLSFTGVVTDLTDPNGYTLNTDFIIPQYQIAAQYVVWETGVGLVDKTFSQIITFTRASTGTYFDSAGTLQTAAIDAPRLDYNPSTLAAQGFLIEEARTNLLTYSAQYDNAAWTKETSVSVSANTTVAPDGTTTGDTVTADQDRAIYQSVAATIGITYCQSVFIKAGTATSILFRDDTGAGRNITINPSTGAITATGGTLVTSGSQAIGNGWWRYWFAYVADATTVRGLLRPNTAGAAQTFIVWGAQTEAGAFPTSYIPTTTTALTRSADVAFVNTLSPWFNSTEYTLYHEGMVLTNNDGIVYSGVGDTFDNTAYFSRVAPNQIGAVLSSAAPVAQMNVNTTPSSGVPFKMAMKVKANDFAFCVNGGSVTTDTAGAVPVSTVRLGIGSSPWTALGGNGRQQWVRRITFYPRGLSSAELQTITA